MYLFIWFLDPNCIIKILVRLQHRNTAGTDGLLILRHKCIDSNVLWEEDSDAVVEAGQRGLVGAADVDCFWQRLLAGAGRQACLYVLTACLFCWSKCRLALTLMYTDKAVRVNSEGSERGGGRRWLPHLAHLSDDGNKGLMNHSESGQEQSQRAIRGVIVTRWGFFFSAGLFLFHAGVAEWNFSCSSTGSYMLISENSSWDLRWGRGTYL